AGSGDPLTNRATNPSPPTTTLFAESIATAFAPSPANEVVSTGPEAVLRSTTATWVPRRPLSSSIDPAAAIIGPRVATAASACEGGPIGAARLPNVVSRVPSGPTRTRYSPCEPVAATVTPPPDSGNSAHGRSDGRATTPFAPKAARVPSGASFRTNPGFCDATKRLPSPATATAFPSPAGPTTVPSGVPSG